MAKTYKGSLSLEWHNKQRAILLKDSNEAPSSLGDVPAPYINWVNKDEALFYEIIDKEGRGLKPYWVNRNDLRIKESRPLILQKTYVAHQIDTPGTIPGSSKSFEIQESIQDIPEIENILIKGDNLLALNTLKKHFESKPDDEKIKCIYIDPPYNTGYAFDQYDDSLAHSEWLTLMRDRLIILRDLLSEDGCIWISIDDEECHYLKVLCDGIFGRNNFIANFIWEKRLTRENRRKFSFNHDHILLFAKDKAKFEETINVLPFSEEAKKRYGNPDNDPRGPWQSVLMLAQAGHATKSQFYTIISPSGKQLNPPPGNCWRYTESRFKEELSKGNIFFTKNGEGVPRIKNFLKDNAGLTPETLWFASEVETNDKAKKHNVSLLENNEESVFETPKPEQLLERIIHISTSPGQIVLDCFGGSGTTFSTAFKMNRKWIGIEIGEHAENQIIPRLIKVISGKDKGGITDSSNYLGGGAFKYYHLGPSIISPDGSGGGDFNWSLGIKFIEESLLLSYDYLLNTTIKFQANQIFETKDRPPTIGLQIIGNKTRVAIISLNEPTGKFGIMTYEEIQTIYKITKSKFAPEYINIFTNRGVEMAYDSKPDDLEIIKVPHSIFAELEK